MITLAVETDLQLYVLDNRVKRGAELLTNHHVVGSGVFCFLVVKKKHQVSAEEGPPVFVNLGVSCRSFLPPSQVLVVIGGYAVFVFLTPSQIKSW